MTGAVKGSPTEKLHQELAIQNFRSRRWFGKLCLFYKTYKNKSPPSKMYTTRNSNNITPFKLRHSFFKKDFFHQ